MVTAGIDYIITAFLLTIMLTMFFCLICRQLTIIVKIKMNGSSAPWVVKTEAQNHPTAAVTWF